MTTTTERTTNDATITRTATPNRYSGTCSTCQGRVEIGEGFVHRGDGKWLTTHNECPPAVPEPISGTEAISVWPGIYTVVLEDHYRTFRVRIQPSDAKFAPGSTILEYLAGKNNDSDYTGFAFVKDGRLVLWKRFRDDGVLADDARAFLADPDAALVAKHCARCGETLSVPTSVAQGFGPTCVKKGLR